MCVIFMTNYSFSGRRRLIDSETFLLTDFINLKIKLTQSFRCTHKSRLCIRVLIEMNAHIYISICVSKKVF
jgi:hypothetical protein